jgi:hypothetical protein
VSSIPPLFTALVDDAAVFPPGHAPLPEAVSGHRTHRRSWYADLVGPLLVPASRVGELGDAAGEFPIGLIGAGPVTSPGGAVTPDGGAGLDGLEAALAGGLAPRQVEIAVARRGEDPVPGLRSLLAWRADRLFEVYAEIPLTWGCVEALDVLAASGGAGESGPGEPDTGRRGAYPKFRTGGLAAELFPSPMDLASVIVACAERGLRFKLTAGLHHAVRHPDPATGFTHHGFLNVLVASAAAAAGDKPAAVADLLALTTPEPLVREARGILDADRPLWIGFGSCSVAEPLDDLVDLGLLSKEIPR